MSFLQPWMLWAIPLIALPIVIHLLNQWRYQTKRWGAMMFLLAANRMNRGYARLRQWLILTMRTLAIAGLILAVSRPLASGFLGLAGGSKTDATLVLLDRSPSMQEQGSAGPSKLDTGRQQLARTLGTLGGSQWVLIESNRSEGQAFGSLENLIDSPAMRGSSSTASMSGMLQGVVDYLNANKPGPTDVWICSDLRSSDWQPESGHWNVVREALASFPQSVRIHLLAYPKVSSDNLSIRVSQVRRESDSSGDSVSISMKVSQSADEAESITKREVPIQIEIDGARSEMTVELTGREVEIRNHRVPVSAQQQKGWGKVSLPADQNLADNDFYFVYSQADVRKTVLVTEDREATRPLEIAASIAPDGTTDAKVEVISPDGLDSLTLDDAALLIWQTSLPQGPTAAALLEYVGRGGQVFFFPPTEVTSGIGASTATFQGVRWSGWSEGAATSQPTNDDTKAAAALPADAGATSGDEDPKPKGALVENWRGDQDLLAVTRSGGGLPVGQLEIRSYATLEGEFSQLATLTGGKPLLARAPTNKGGVYFCCVTPGSGSSSLATNGIVLYAIIQRAIEQGLSSLGNATQRVAGHVEESTDTWRAVATGIQKDASLSSEYAWTVGVYENDGRMFAINRTMEEDQRDIVDDKQLARMFAGLDFSRVDDQAGSLAGIVSEIWRFFLIAMIVALLVEAALCMPRKTPLTAAPSFMQVPTT